ncbi:MAG: reverse transcriptase domain-containing protein, partial [Candidatus Micrarchaeaceae archaeon]
MVTPNSDSVPQTIKEALSGPDADKWRTAIKSEMRSLLQNHTWDLVKRPGGKEIVPSRWIFKVKEDGRYKARMVARGFTQTFGVDYFETYAPVARFASIRMILALAAKFGLSIQQMDVDTAFLYGALEEDIYMEQPDGFIDDPELVCKLQKSLYDLKQAPCVWYQVMDGFFKSLGLERSRADPAVYIEQDPLRGQLPLIVAIYVDDLIIVHKDMAKINKIKEALNAKFNMKDLGEVKNLLGIEVHRLPDGSVFINQPRYVEKLLKRYGMENCKPADTPMALKITPSDDEYDMGIYQSLTGGLMWPSLCTRPDIAFAVGYLARWNSKPTRAHHVAQKRVLRYLKGTIGHGILFKANTDQKLEGFSDADWAGDIEDRKSISGNC